MNRSPLKLCRLSEFNDIKDFVISSCSIEEATRFRNEFLVLSKKSMSFAELSAQLPTSDVFLSVNIRLDSLDQLAALQYVLSVRRNKLKTKLFYEGTNAARRVQNFRERVGVLSNINAHSDILKKQPIYTEYE